jgi:hypothetical protein
MGIFVPAMVNSAPNTIVVQQDPYLPRKMEFETRVKSGPDRYLVTKKFLL